MRGRLLPLTLLVAAGLVAGWAPTEAQAHQQTAGYNTVTVKKAGFSIAVPETWHTIDFSKKYAQQILDKLREEMPEIAESLPTDAAEAAKLVTLFAIDPAGATLNAILSAEVPVLPTPQQYKSVLKQSAVGAAIGGLTAKYTKVDGTKAVKTEYRATVAGRRLHAVQYLVIGSQGGLFFTFVAPADDDTAAGVAKTMIKSVALL